MTISKRRLAEIASIRDEDIDYSDIPELDDNFWANAELKMSEKKSCIMVRIDSDGVHPSTLYKKNSLYSSPSNRLFFSFNSALRQLKSK